MANQLRFNMKLVYGLLVFNIILIISGLKYAHDNPMPDYSGVAVTRAILETSGLPDECDCTCTEFPEYKDYEVELTAL